MSSTEPLGEVIFYRIEQAIKSYRQFAQKQLRAKGFRITIDQWLVLKTLSEFPGITQSRLAVIVFKEEASITRTLSLMEKQKILKRGKTTDKRENALAITAKGRALLRDILPVIRSNRTRALAGIPAKAIREADKVMRSITGNCEPGKKRKKRNDVGQS